MSTVIRIHPQACTSAIAEAVGDVTPLLMCLERTLAQIEKGDVDPQHMSELAIFIAKVIAQLSVVAGVTALPHDIRGMVDILIATEQERLLTLFAPTAPGSH